MGQSKSTVLEASKCSLSPKYGQKQSARLYGEIRNVESLAHMCTLLGIRSAVSLLLVSLECTEQLACAASSILHVLPPLRLLPVLSVDLFLIPDFFQMRI